MGNVLKKTAFLPLFLFYVKLLEQFLSQQWFFIVYFWHMNIIDPCNWIDGLWNEWMSKLFCIKIKKSTSLYFSFSCSRQQPPYVSIVFFPVSHSLENELSLNPLTVWNIIGKCGKRLAWKKCMSDKTFFSQSKNRINLGEEWCFDLPSLPLWKLAFNTTFLSLHRGFMALCLCLNWGGFSPEWHVSFLLI